MLRFISHSALSSTIEGLFPAATLSELGHRVGRHIPTAELSRQNSRASLLPCLLFPCSIRRESPVGKTRFESANGGSRLKRRVAAQALCRLWGPVAGSGSVSAGSAGPEVGGMAAGGTVASSPIPGPRSRPELSKPLQHGVGGGRREQAPVRGCCPWGLQRLHW